MKDLNGLRISNLDVSLSRNSDWPVQSICIEFKIVTVNIPERVMFNPVTCQSSEITNQDRRAHFDPGVDSLYMLAIDLITWRRGPHDVKTIFLG